MGNENPESGSYTESDAEILTGKILSAEERIERHLEQEASKLEPWIPAGPEILGKLDFLPPPTRAAPMYVTSTHATSPANNIMIRALNRIQKEVKAMMDAQAKIGARKLGYYFDPEITDSNIFQCK